MSAHDSVVTTGEHVYDRVRTKLLGSPCKIKALGALIMPYGVRQLAAAHALAADQACSAVTPFARGLYDTAVNVKPFDEASTGVRAGAYLAYSVVVDEVAEEAFSPGAAPITLIDGEKLIDLLLEHGIGVRKRTIELLEVDAEAFTALELAD
jgi:hypothetical protein